MTRPDFSLSDGVILLRPPRAEDAPAVLAAQRESLAELQPWLDWATPAFAEEAALRRLQHFQQAWQNSSAFHFAIFSADEGHFLGECGLDGVDLPNGACNLSYWVRTSATRQGCASRAIRLAAAYALQNLGLRKVEILIAAGNLPSQRAALKAGARLEKTIKDGLVVRTSQHDALLFTLSPTDFTA